MSARPEATLSMIGAKGAPAEYSLVDGEKYQCTTKLEFTIGLSVLHYTKQEKLQLVGTETRSMGRGMRQTDQAVRRALQGRGTVTESAC